MKYDNDDSEHEDNETQFSKFVKKPPRFRVIRSFLGFQSKLLDNGREFQGQSSDSAIVDDSWFVTRLILKPFEVECGVNFSHRKRVKHKQARTCSGALFLAPEIAGSFGADYLGVMIVYKTEMNGKANKIHIRTHFGIE